ncbi:MAG TPA: PDZ domain-containing protein [Kofleriaceae bacterium]|jgi:predicted metalloprotease with PDZ domain|nr:PDZ domain-containing protein [Kofleriaceae bacterium]
MLKWEDVTRMASRLNGVPVLGCRPGSPAACAGVRYGDIMLSVNGLPTPDWASYIEAKATVHGQMTVELFRAGQTLVFEFALPAQTEQVDPTLLLDELIENGLTPLMMSDAHRRDPEPS